MGTRQVPLCWPEPGCSVSGYSSMSLVSASSGHAEGTDTLQLLVTLRLQYTPGLSVTVAHLGTTTRSAGIGPRRVGCGRLGGQRSAAHDVNHDPLLGVRWVRAASPAASAVEGGMHSSGCTSLLWYYLPYGLDAQVLSDLTIGHPSLSERTTKYFGFALTALLH